MYHPASHQDHPQVAIDGKKLLDIGRAVSFEIAIQPLFTLDEIDSRSLG
jgi:hypothetical protein